MMTSADQPFRSLVALVGLAVFLLCGGLLLMHQWDPGGDAGPGVPPGSGPLIIVDAGHGGADGGAASGGLLEKDLTLEVAGYLGDDLRRAGLRVLQTRTADAAISLQQRTRIANARQEALFVSVHFNTAVSGDPEGAETYHTAPKSLTALAGIKRRYGLPRGSRLHDDRNRLLAQEVQRALVEAAGCPGRGFTLTRVAHKGT
ncbi:MAG: N-acetylmuramoyl-L-alanine amidase, partial [Verrucomicrobiales bacterium]